MYVCLLLVVFATAWAIADGGNRWAILAMRTLYDYTPIDYINIYHFLNFFYTIVRLSSNNR